MRIKNISNKLIRIDGATMFPNDELTLSVGSSNSPEIKCYIDLKLIEKVSDDVAAGSVASDVNEAVAKQTTIILAPDKIARNEELLEHTQKELIEIAEALDISVKKTDSKAVIAAAIIEAESK